MKEIVLATRNKAKAREVKKILGKLLPGMKFVSLARFRPEPVEETGRTLEENAAKKAIRAAKLAGLPALAEDSGLFVEALGGRPGVKSSRYAGRGDAANRNKLLKEMAGVPAARRVAVFRCVSAFATPGGRLFFSRGECRGRIAFVERGKTGFGYDPLFIPAGFKKTFAELGPTVKDKISHRARALEGIAPVIRRVGLRQWSIVRVRSGATGIRTPITGSASLRTILVVL